MMFAMKLSLTRRDYGMLLSGVLLTLLIFGIGRLVYLNQVPVRPKANHVTTYWIPPTVRHWDKQINDNAKKYNIDPDLIAIIMTMESGGDSKAHSSADAEGLMQITKPTAK